MKNFIVLLLLIFAFNANALSLSGDDWKNPLRTKTWTPPSETDTILGKKDKADLNVLTDGSFEKFATAVDWVGTSGATINPTIALADIVTNYNKKMLTVSYLGGAKLKTTWNTTLEGVSGFCRFKYYSTSALALNILSGTTVVESLSLSSASQWQEASIAFTTTGSPMHCEIESFGAGNYFIDDVEFGANTFRAFVKDNTSTLGVGKIQFPNNQITKVSKDTVRIENGNDNALKNPSFESPLIESLGTLGWISNANKVFSTDAVDGKQAIVITGNTGLSRAPRITSTTVAINGATLENQLIIGKAWYKGAGLNNSSVCILPIDGSGPVDADEACVAFGNSQGLWITKIASLRVKSTYTGYQIVLGSSVVSSNVETFDKAYASIYDPKDQATILGFKNDSTWRPCTFSTLAWSGYGTVTNNLDCKRDGTNLKIRGDFINGTVASAIVNIPLPTNFGNISYVKKSANHSVGFSLRIVASLFVLQNIFVNTTVGDNGLYSSGSIVAASINPLSAAQGTGNFATGERVSISGELSIPIAEWSENTNGALVTCKEGPLKCANTYAIHVSSTGVIKSQPEGWVSSVSVARIDFTSGIFTTPPICVLSPDNQANNTTGSRINLTSSKDFLSWTSYTGASGVTTGAFIHCTKTAPDYNAGYEKVLGLTEDADIRSTEWLTGGYDYIDGKPIYRRCHKVVSDITTNTTLMTLGNINPKNATNYISDLWLLGTYSYIETTSLYGIVEYAKTLGVLQFKRAGAIKLGAGTNICIDYTKN